MKAENVVINVLVALVALLAGHIFWPAPAPENKMLPSPPAASPVAVAPNAVMPPGAQAAPPPTSPSPQFPADLRAKLDKARTQAFADDPKLKAEEDDLMKERDALMKKTPPASMADRQALMLKWADHSKKMRTAMAKEDPTLQSFFDMLDARIKERQVQAATGTATNGTPLSPVTASH